MRIENKEFYYKMQDIITPLILASVCLNKQSKNNFCIKNNYFKIRYFCFRFESKF